MAIVSACVWACLRRPGRTLPIAESLYLLVLVAAFRIDSHYHCGGAADRLLPWIQASGPKFAVLGLGGGSLVAIWWLRPPPELFWAPLFCQCASNLALLVAARKALVVYHSIAEGF